MNMKELVIKAETRNVEAKKYHQNGLKLKLRNSRSHVHFYLQSFERSLASYYIPKMFETLLGLR